MSQTSVTQFKQMATVMIPTTDQDRSVEFYVDKLGFEKRADIPFGENGGNRWIELAVPGSETTIAPSPERGEWRAGRMTGISLTSEDVHAAHAQLRDAGVDVDEQVMHIDGPPPDMFWFRDADGNSLLIVQSRP